MKEYGVDLRGQWEAWVEKALQYQRTPASATV
jgi:hypothetical protein